MRLFHFIARAHDHFDTLQKNECIPIELFGFV